jgi:hypothetical protein
MAVAHDKQNLYVFVRLPLYDSAASTGSTGNFGLAIASLKYTTTDSIPPADPWGCDIHFLYPTEITPGDTANVFPDVIIRGNIVGRDCCAMQDNGWTELRTWDGSNYDTGAGVNWGGATGAALVGDHFAFADSSGVEFAIPFADLGITELKSQLLYLQFFTTQLGGTKGAYDTVPEDDQSNGWDDGTVQKRLVSYAVIEVPVAQETWGGLKAKFKK